MEAICDESTSHMGEGEGRGEAHTCCGNLSNVETIQIKFNFDCSAIQSEFQNLGLYRAFAQVEQESSQSQPSQLQYFESGSTEPLK